MFIPSGAPLPPEIHKHEREYRANRIRQGSTSDPITALFSIFVILCVAVFRMLRWGFRKLTLKRGVTQAGSQDAVVQQIEVVEDTQTWKSRS